jgi:hypothetical protein
MCWFGKKIIGGHRESFFLMTVRICDADLINICREDGLLLLPPVPGESTKGK